MHQSPVPKRLWLALVAAFFAVCPQVLRAQPEPTLDYFGLGGALNINQHSLEREVYRGSDFCGVFTEGSGLRPSFHFLFETKPGGWPIWLSPRLTYNNLGGELAAAAVDNARVRDPIDSSLVSSDREHRIDASIPAIGLDLFGKYKFDRTFFVFAGPSISLLLSPSGEQQEVITAPSNGFFDETGTNTRTLHANALANAGSIHAAFGIGLGADIPIVTRWTVTPEISAHFPLTSIVSDDNWKVTQYRFGLTIKLDNTPSPPKPEEPVFVDRINGTVQLLGIERQANGTVREFETPSIRVEEFVSREAFPVLNAIFFAPNSPSIPDRYAKARSLDTGLFRGRDALNAHHHLLEILGHRMSISPGANITLRGIQTADETPADIGAQRARAVADYLTTQWGIAASRVQVETETRQIANDPQLLEEQRKVEIVTNDLALFDPFIVQDVTRTMNPPGLRVRSSIDANAAVTSSNVTISQGGGLNIGLGQQRPAVDWYPADPTQFPSTEQPIFATLNGSTARSSVTVRDSALVQQVTVRKKRAERIADLEIERYNLITFEFDKATLDARAERIMKMIAEEATSRDSIEVAGYTDLIGDQAYNQRLATDRARNVETALRTQLSTTAPGALIASHGEGERDLYNNSLPEGRQLSRTVRITIKRPIGE